MDVAVTPTVTVVLPVYNEATHFPETLDTVLAFAAARPDYHLAFVDDGSTDDTGLAIRRRLAASRLPNVELLSYARRRGKGHAVRVGTRGARGRFVCFTDGDLAYPLDYLPQLLEALETHDVVIGSRSRGDPAERTIKRSRQAMGWLFNRLVRAFLGLPFRDTQAGLKGFRREAAERLFARQRLRGFCFDVELMYIAKRAGYKIGEIPVRVSERHSYKASNVNLWRDPGRMLLDLIAIRLNGSLGRYD